MLLPFEWAVLTVEEAKELVVFIEEVTASRGLKRDYEQMAARGVLSVYNSLRSLVERAREYEDVRAAVERYS